MYKPVQRLLTKIPAGNRHFVWVIIFFVLHGYSEYLSLIPVTELLFLLVQLLAVGIILYWLSNKLLRDQQKTGLFTSFALILVLFFGAFQDFFAGYRLIAAMGRLAYFLPLCLVIIILLFIWLKRTKKRFNRLVLFINGLFIIYLFIDGVKIGSRLIFPAGKNDTVNAKYQFGKCDTCSKPPVYLVILDEYAGSDALREFFRFDNAVFENFLRQQGFHVNNHAHSNYMLTLYSMASLFEMDYLQNSNPPDIKNYFAYKKALKTIRNNNVCNFFELQGYKIINYSDFDIKEHPAGYSSELAGKIRLITNQTMYYRVAKNLPHMLAERGGITWFTDKLENELINTNEEKMKSVLRQSQKVNDQPAFTYLHLAMPHTPYSFDSTGRRVRPVTERKSFTENDISDAYIQYLVYTNKKISGFILNLQQATNGKAVIILMSDHGHRRAYRMDKSFGFQSLNAVYLPGQQYGLWYDGVSNVNQFRLLFNTLFHQKMPVLKDSSVY